MISARQALQQINSLLQQAPNHDIYLYIRLKLLYMMGDCNAFDEYFKDYDPKTYEFIHKKVKHHAGIINTQSGKNWL